MQLTPMKVLSGDEINRIHEASIDILENCGVKVFNVKMLDFLRERGLVVDMDQKVVRFSRAVIEDALSSIPQHFEVHDREGRLLFDLGGGRPRIAAGHNAIFWVDGETGEASRPRGRGGTRRRTKTNAPPARRGPREWRTWSSSPICASSSSSST